MAFELVPIATGPIALIMAPKLCTLQLEYFLSAVNMLTNSLKISDQTNANFFQLNISQMHGKIGYWWCRADFSSVWNSLTR